MKKNITKKCILAALSISVATSTFAFAADNTTTQTQLNTNNSSKKIAFQNFTKTKPTVSLDSARLSAIKDAGVDESNLEFINISLRPSNIDRQNPPTTQEEFNKLNFNYEVEFATFDNKEYDYTIDAKTGAIVEKDNEIEKGRGKGGKHHNFANKDKSSDSNSDVNKSERAKQKSQMKNKSTTQQNQTQATTN